MEDAGYEEGGGSAISEKRNSNLENQDLVQIHSETMSGQGETQSEIPKESKLTKKRRFRI